MGLYTYDDNRLLRRIIRTVVYLVVIISTAWFVVYGFMGQTVISGQSMSPVLNAEDVCLVNRLKYDILSPDRYDIALMERADSGKLIAKRVIGLPGETVLIRDGSVYIDGEILKDDRLAEISLAGIAENPVDLGSDEYFVIGDNTESSEDSRFANIGNVKRSAMKGKIWFRIKPAQNVGVIR